MKYFADDPNFDDFGNDDNSCYLSITLKFQNFEKISGDSSVLFFLLDTKSFIFILYTVSPSLLNFDLDAMLLFHWVQDLMELLQNLFEIKDPAEAQHKMDDLKRVCTAPFDPIPLVDRHLIQICAPSHDCMTLMTTAGL